MSRAMRSRAVRRPFACCDSMAFAPPPSRILSCSRATAPTRSAMARAFFWKRAELGSRVDVITFCGSDSTRLSAIGSQMKPSRVANRVRVSLAAGVILPFGVPLQLRAVEINIAQIASAVPFGFIIEVPGPRITALAAHLHGFCSNAVTEFDHSNEAVPRGAVPLLSPRIGLGAERSERSPARVGESDRNAWIRVAELRNEVVVEALESIDLAPRGFPGTEICGEFFRSTGQSLEQLFRRTIRRYIVSRCNSFVATLLPEASPNVLTPEDCKRCRNRIHAPAQIP